MVVEMGVVGNGSELVAVGEMWVVVNGELVVVGKRILAMVVVGTCRRV